MPWTGGHGDRLELPRAAGAEDTSPPRPQARRATPAARRWCRTRHWSGAALAFAIAHELAGFVPIATHHDDPPPHVASTVCPDAPAASRNIAAFRANRSVSNPQFVPGVRVLRGEADGGVRRRRRARSAGPSVTGGGRSGLPARGHASRPPIDLPRKSAWSALDGLGELRPAFVRLEHRNNVTCSAASTGSPAPIPTIMRPPLAASTVATSFASRPALRSDARVTSVPILGSASPRRPRRASRRP